MKSFTEYLTESKKTYKFKIGVANELPEGFKPIATSENYKDRKTGEKVSQTEWHNIVAWRGLAEIAEKYLKKGAKVYIEGKLKTRTWQDKEGNNRYSTEVITDSLTMLGSTGESMGSSSQEKPVENESKPSPEKEFSSPDDNDDLPF